MVFAAYVRRAKTTFLPATLPKILNRRRDSYATLPKILNRRRDSYGTLAKILNHGYIGKVN